MTCQQPHMFLYPNGRVEVGARAYTEEQQEYILLWFARNKKETFHKIVCPDCVSHSPHTPAPTADQEELTKAWMKPHDAATARKAREDFVELIEDKLPRYPSGLGDMYLLSDIQGLAPQQAGEP